MTISNIAFFTKEELQAIRKTFESLCIQAETSYISLMNNEFARPTDIERVNRESAFYKTIVDKIDEHL